MQRFAFLNAAFETGIANPSDAAIIAAAEARHGHVNDARKIDGIPYDFARKRLTIVVHDLSAAGHLVSTKGAFSNVLAVCEIEPDDRERCERYCRKMSEEGFRVLAVVMRSSRIALCAVTAREIAR